MSLGSIFTTETILCPAIIGTIYLRAEDNLPDFRSFDLKLIDRFESHLLISGKSECQSGRNSLRQAASAFLVIARGSHPFFIPASFFAH